ncbi:metallophosphoesterase [Granulicella aggregans]|uniref:metallophosphoesterase n=1 Tax=Granulicella aggregans TaxID=474949 RepID=UPI0021E0BB28|nr:metallophosphoesterase [Granulicella aggregans]
MKLAIVHLSDIHFKSASDVGLRRRAKLSNTIAFSRSPEEELIFVITGDIANTGDPAEYQIAIQFFTSLLADLGIDIKANPAAMTFIPGNHDCNFRGIGDLRPRLLDEIPSQLESIDACGETVETLLQVQSPFYQFVMTLTGEQIPLEDRLLQVRKLAFGNFMLEFRCFNSSWLSRRNEEPGSLGFPTSVFTRASEKTDADVVISLVHHPSNWLNPISHQSFRRAVQESSDILITGHEHLQGGQVVAPFSGSHLVHFESGAYQPHDSGESAFGIIHLDLDSRTSRHEEFRWSTGSYVKPGSDKVVPLGEKHARVNSLQVVNNFILKMTDPGTGFLHPRQQDLRLSDIFVYPDLKTRSISRKLQASGDLPRNISSAEVPTRVLNTSALVIAGPPDCGKSALGKSLFIEANTKHSRFSLMIKGQEIVGADPGGAFNSAVDSAIDEQYGPGNRGCYAGLNRNDRVLIIDDWDEAKFSRPGRSAILKHATAHFGCTILFVDDIFLIQELSRGSESSPLSGFQIADIREFGFRLRGQLIAKWHSLGTTFLEEERVLARRIADSTRVVDTVLGRNLLPSYPVNILTLLQTYDADAGSQNGGLGSYGQVYEALITARLGRVSMKSIDIGTKITFLSRVAWRLFTSQKRHLSQSEWRQQGEQYYKEYKIPLDSDQLLLSLLDAGIIAEDVDGFRFSYGYGYCYFVAKYFQENLADLDEGSGRADLFRQLKSLSERVYKQDNSNIIIFYVFLTKDRSLINHIIANAQRIFKDVPEFDFDSHLDFVNQIITPDPVMHLPDCSVQENRERLAQRRDESGESIEPSSDPSVSDIVYGEKLPIEQKLIIGIRYLSLMGQVLRNFPGSLKAEIKLELAFESYSLGLRILGAVFSLTHADAEKLTEDISKVLRTRMAFTGTDRELRSRAELIIAEMLREVTFALLKRMSHAIGLRELEATYEEVAELRDNSLSSRLIQLAIRLDHFVKFPKQDVEYLATELGANTFTYQTLRDLVLDHFYLFPEDYTIQQWAGNLLSFAVNTALIRGTSKKLLKAGSA